MWRSVLGECETTSMVLPALRKSSMRSKHFAWESLIANGQGLIDHENVGIDIDGDRKRETHDHAGEYVRSAGR